MPSAKLYLVWCCVPVCACCVTVCLYWLPPRPGSYLFSEVRRQFCLYVFVCACDTRLVHASRAHTHCYALLSYMPEFGLFFRGSVIIQRGKQPAPDLISCLGSHREVRKYYQLITVLPASPAFSLIALPREDSASLLIFCLWMCVCMCVAYVSNLPPAAAHVSEGCVRPGLHLSWCQTDSSGEPTHGKGKLERSAKEHMLRAWVSQPLSTQQPHTPHVMAANPAKPQKAMGQSTDIFPIYHSVLYLRGHTAVLPSYQNLDTTANWKNMTIMQQQKQKEKKHTGKTVKYYFDSCCYFVEGDSFAMAAVVGGTVPYMSGFADLCS